jgi:hypothetical protein
MVRPWLLLPLQRVSWDGHREKEHRHVQANHIRRRTILRCTVDVGDGSNCDPHPIGLMSPPANTGHVPRPTRLTKGMTPLAHPQEMPEIRVQLGARIRPPPPHHLSNVPSSPARPSLGLSGPPCGARVSRALVRSRRAGDSRPLRAVRCSERGVQGTLPSGVMQISSPNNSVLLIGRVLVYSDSDLPTAYNIEKQIRLTPLSQTN